MKLDGSDKLVIWGPFRCCLSDGREVLVEKVVIVSKNGEVANLSVSRLKIVKDKILELLLETAKNQHTVSGLESSLEQGAIVLGKGCFWLKPETEIHPSDIVRKEEPPKTFQELRGMARKIIFD